MICNHPGARYVVVTRGPLGDQSEELCETCEKARIEEEDLQEQSAIAAVLLLLASL